MKVVVSSELRAEHLIAVSVQDVDYCCYGLWYITYPQAFERLMLFEEIVINLQVLRFSQQCC
jgi:hypothetical protein